MLQTPGPLTTTGPTGAKAWTHGCCLTAAVTSHRCTGLVGGKDGNKREERKHEVGGKGKGKRLVWVRDREDERNCEAAQ